MVAADVHDAPAVEPAVEVAADVVLSMLGTPFTYKQVDIYSVGIGNIAHAMSQHGVKRLVVVSSSATEPHHHAAGGFLMNHVIQRSSPRLSARQRTQTCSAWMVGASDLEWTIVRPSGLFDAPCVTSYELHEVRHRESLPAALTSLHACSNKPPTGGSCIKRSR